MSWLRLIDVDANMMFNPRVKPDPADAKRLDERLQEVIQYRNRELESRRMFRLTSVPTSTKNEAGPMQRSSPVSSLTSARSLNV